MSHYKKGTHSSDGVIGSPVNVFVQRQLSWIINNECIKIIAN